MNHAYRSVLLAVAAVLLGGCHDLSPPVTSTEPVAVAGGLRFRSVAAGTLHTCGITTSDSSYCWGWNRDGELGDGSQTDRTVPVAVSSGVVWSSVTAGGGHTCGIVGGGGAYCWGFNLSGQLGDGTTSTRLTPVPVSAGTDYTSITAGGAYTCGLHADSSAACGTRSAMLPALP